MQVSCKQGSVFSFLPGKGGSTWGFKLRGRCSEASQTQGLPSADFPKAKVTPRGLACGQIYSRAQKADLLPVNAIQRAYLVASLRQWEATSKPHVTVSEMIPMMMKNKVVTHSGGNRGGIQVLSRP